MAKLRYSIAWTGADGPTPAGPQISSSYIGGATGTPQTRSYRTGDSLPAFVNYPLALTGMLAGNHHVEYKDSSVALQALATLAMSSYAQTCWNGGAYINPTWRLTRFETYFEVRGIISAGAGTTEVSLDNASWKTLTNDGSGYAATWSNSEIADMGYVDTIPTIRVRRIYETNLLSVGNFSNVSVGGGPTLTRIDVSGSTAGYIIGDFVRFKNSTLYNALSGYVVEVHAAYLVLQMAYMGNQSGATAYERATCNDILAANVFIGEISINPFEATITGTNETAPDSDDGTATLAISGGSGIFTFDWSDGATSQNRTGLQAGSYSVEITDTVTGQTATLEITITEPAPEPPAVGTYLDVPKMQSLRFVREAVIDNCSTFQNFDNTLFCKMVFYGVKIRKPFYQKVCRCDVFPIQVHSNFPIHTVELCSQVTGAQVKNFNNMELKQQLSGLVSPFDMYLTNSGTADPDGTSRVYFNTGTIPLPVSLGDTFDLINNADGYNGTYSVAGISNDELLGAPYLLINLAYGAPNPTSAGRAVFITSVLDFDVFETILNFADVDPGIYFVRIRGVNVDASFTEFISEPIDVRSAHPSTNLVEFRNFDNDADIVYTTGITHRIRLESKLQKPLPGRADENYRESNGSPVKLSSKRMRKYKLEYFEQPFYRLELLDVLFGFDRVLINKVEYFCEEGTSEPANRDFYVLANGNATIEQKQWFQQYNGDDLGGVDPGYILTQYGYIQRT